MTDMMTTTTTRLAGGVAAIFGLMLPACSTGTRTVPDGTGTPTAVTVATVTMNGVADTVEAGGVVQAQTTATITARIMAPVSEVRVTAGDHVRAGQVLIVLDGRDLAARAQSARAAALASSQNATAAAAEQQAADAVVALARATHERISGLFAKRSATAQELDDATGALRAAQARVAGAAAREQAALSEVESARAASQEAATTESFALITAPFDGIVAEKMVEPGNMAAPGTPLVRIEDTRGFRLDVRVDESRVGQIAVGAIVPVAVDSATPGEPAALSGTVAEMSRAAEADPHAFLIKITLPHRDGLRSGAFGRARFSGPARRALTVPAGALVHQGQITSVFVVEKSVAHIRLVNVSGNEVLAGLSDGDVVVVDPPPTTTDGRTVTVRGR